MAIALIASMVGISLPAQIVSGQTKLVVGIMVDGLQQEYLDLLRQYFGQGGFNRLINDGVFIANADYGTPLDQVAATAMLMTGASPSVSGIQASAYFDRAQMRPIKTLLDPEAMGNYTDETYSPKGLAVSTLSDEVRIAGDGVTYVYSIAPDPSQAIILAGHAGNCGVWLNDNTGNWATTTYYTDVPSVVTSRNRLTPLSSRLDTLSWTPSKSADKYPLLPDHITHYPFRYIFPRNKSTRYEMFKMSALFNTEVTDLAIEHINTLKLGQHDGTDMLNIGFTVKPYAYSKTSDSRFELLDTYFKLDHDLEQLFSAIDRSIGLRNSIIFLAATPQSQRSRRDDERWRIPYGEFSSRKAISLLNMYLIAIHGNGEWVSAFHDGEFFLNHRLIKERNKDLRSMRAEASDFLSRMSGVDEVYTLGDIISGRAGDNAQVIKRNTSSAHSGDIRISICPGWEIVDDYNKPGSVPSQVFRYVSTTAPVFILSPDVAPQRIDTPVDIRVIAPTMARLLRIRSPNAASLPALQLD